MIYTRVFNIICLDMLLYIAEKRQYSLFIWLKDVLSPKTARVSKMRTNETGNEEHEEEHDINEVA